MNKIDKNWKERYEIWQEQCKIAEEIKSELLKKLRLNIRGIL